MESQRRRVDGGFELLSSCLRRETGKVKGQKDGGRRRTAAIRAPRHHSNHCLATKMLPASKAKNQRNKSKSNKEETSEFFRRLEAAAPRSTRNARRRLSVLRPPTFVSKECRWLKKAPPLAGRRLLAHGNSSFFKLKSVPVPARRKEAESGTSGTSGSFLLGVQGGSR